VIDAYGKLESNLITLFSDAETKIGWEKRYTKLLYTDTLKISNESKIGLGSAIENRLNLMKRFKNCEIMTTQPKIHMTSNELEAARKKITTFSKTEDSSFIMISALGSHPKKTYPLAYMAKVLDYVAQHTEALLILNYMPSQKEQIMQLNGLCNKITQSQILLDFEVGTIREFLAITKFCKAVIGNEGGAINMAKALDVPTFSIFSPWIDKQGWNGFENHNLKHASVHVNDYKKDINMSENEAFTYDEFKPDFYLNLLSDFLLKHVD
jgi:heptosyltransferase-2